MNMIKLTKRKLRKAREDNINQDAKIRELELKRNEINILLDSNAIKLKNI